MSKYKPSFSIDLGYSYEQTSNDLACAAMAYANYGSEPHYDALLAVGITPAGWRQRRRELLAELAAAAEQHRFATYRRFDALYPPKKTG